MNTEPTEQQQQLSELRREIGQKTSEILRLIGERDRVDRDPGLYTFAVTRRDDAFSGSALFAYKLNWQTLVFLGYGDDRTLQDERLEKADRQLFLKVSYAFQR